VLTIKLRMLFAKLLEKEIIIWKNLKENIVLTYLQQMCIRQCQWGYLKKIYGAQMSVHIATLKNIILTGMGKIVVGGREGLLEYFSLNLRAIPCFVILACRSTELTPKSRIFLCLRKDSR
jgi:hypothetical protein